MEKKVFVGLGGNIGPVFQNFQKALTYLEELPEINHLKLSKIYRSTPVSDIPQPPYLNAVCQFKTSLDPFLLLRKLQEIQKKLGQEPKPKNAQRLIDLDILFYGDEVCDSEELQIPHARWQERLFVLIPLSDLTDRVTLREQGVIDVKKMIEEFDNKYQETVLVWEGDDEA